MTGHDLTDAEIQRAIRDNLELAMTLRRLKRRHLELATGLSASAICKKMAGRLRFTPADLTLIEENMGIPQEELLEGTGLTSAIPRRPTGASRVSPGRTDVALDGGSPAAPQPVASAATPEPEAMPLEAFLEEYGGVLNGDARAALGALRRNSPRSPIDWLDIAMLTVRALEGIRAGNVNSGPREDGATR
ncbi:MAG: hypothetical protein MJ058_04300 [Akkermansia sp.]|nr:hypothetical protein [Akkermansia sp.]